MVRTITVTDEAYDALARLKKHPSDSFTKVILRITKRRGDPLKVAGAWKDMTDAQAREMVERSRRDFASLGGHR